MDLLTHTVYRSIKMWLIKEIKGLNSCDPSMYPNKTTTCRKSLTTFITMLYRVHIAWAGFELTTLVVIGTACSDSCISNYNTIVTMTTTLVAYYDFSYHNYHMIVTTTTTLVVEYDFSHHNYHTIVTMTTTLVVEYDLSPQLPYDYNHDDHLSCWIGL
jgi:hypothetical protein